MSKTAAVHNSSRLYTRLLSWAGIIALLFLLRLTASAADQELKTENPNLVKAAFMRNFARYVSWPANAFTADSANWNIGVLGSDPFGSVLDKSFIGRTEQGRSFEIFRADSLSKLPPCQIIFIAYKDAATRRLILAALKNQPVLTVSDAPEFLKEGGIIRFQVGDRVKIDINLDQARSASLKIPAKMLEISHEILENGTMRKWR